MLTLTSRFLRKMVSKIIQAFTFFPNIPDIDLSADDLDQIMSAPSYCNPFGYSHRIDQGAYEDDRTN